MKRRNVIHRLLAAIVVLSGAAVVAAAPTHSRSPACSPDQAQGRAEVFATNNTALITDPGDSRLRDPLQQFGTQVDAIISGNGASLADSNVVDAVFWSDDLQQTTYERSREFHLCGVDKFELHRIANEVRRQFDQESVLTFVYLPENGPDADAVRIEVPDVDVPRFHDELAEDPVARQRLVGGSVTESRTLILVADVADRALALELAMESGGATREATMEYGRRDFVE